MSVNPKNIINFGFRQFADKVAMDQPKPRSVTVKMCNSCIFLSKVVFLTNPEEKTTHLINTSYYMYVY